MAYRNGRKSKRMISGEAKSRKTNRFPLQNVIGTYATIRLWEIIYAPILKCSHIDFNNAVFGASSAIFWRDGWRKTRFRCNSCGSGKPQIKRNFINCECSYVQAMIESKANFSDELHYSIEEMNKAGFSFGYNLFPAESRTLKM